MNEIEGTRPNSCSQAFARWYQEVKTSRMVFKCFSSVQFYWYQNIVCWNISHWYSRGTNLQNSRVQVHLIFPVLSTSCDCSLNSRHFITKRKSNQVSNSLLAKWTHACFYWREVVVRFPASDMCFFVFGLHARWVHSDSAVVSDYQGVGGVSDVCISVHFIHSACQKQWARSIRNIVSASNTLM